MDFNVGASFNNVDCEVFRKRFSAGLIKETLDDNNTPNNPADDTKDYDNWIADRIKINFGDGTSHEEINVISISIFHDYLQIGNFIASVEVDFTDENGNFKQIITENKTIIVSSSCSQESAVESSFKDNGQNTLGIASKLWFNNDIFGVHVGGFTKPYYWDTNSAKWKRDRVNYLRVWVEGQTRDNNCIVGWDDDGFDLENNSIGVTKRLHSLFNKDFIDIADGKNTSDHYAVFNNGTIIYESLSLEPCN